MKSVVFSISVAFISWTIGLILNAAIQNKSFYHYLENFNFIKRDKWNKTIGLGYFKWIVKNTFFKFFNQKIKLKEKNADLSTIRREMTIAEIGHLIGFVFMAIVAIYKGVLGSYLLAFIIMIFNVFMNLYPSLLQQENKRRIDRLIRKKSQIGDY